MSEKKSSYEDGPEVKHPGPVHSEEGLNLRIFPPEDLSKSLSTRQEQVVEEVAGKYSPDKIRKDVEKGVSRAMDAVGNQVLEGRLAKVEPHSYGTQNPQSGAIESTSSAEDAKKVLEGKISGNAQGNDEFGDLVVEVHEHVRKEDERDAMSAVEGAKKELDRVLRDDQEDKDSRKSA